MFTFCMSFLINRSEADTACSGVDVCHPMLFISNVTEFIMNLWYFGCSLGQYSTALDIQCSRQTALVGFGLRGLF